MMKKNMQVLKRKRHQNTTSNNTHHQMNTEITCDQKSSLGFIDDEYFNSSSSLLQSPPPVPPEYNYSEVLNTAPSNHHHLNKNKQTTTLEDQENSTKEKVSKKKQKREREARYAFMTKTESDQLDDGYRWRKYGQKPVKNSPFPRSYYRCTSTACGVKKRVERCCQDTSILITTYEGTHTHPCPITPRATLAAAPNAHFFTIPQMLHYQHQPYFHHFTPPFISTTTTSTNPTLLPPEIITPFCPPLPIRDHGLLQDMLPSKIFKEDQY